MIILEQPDCTEYGTFEKLKECFDINSEQISSFLGVAKFKFKGTSMESTSSEVIDLFKITCFKVELQDGNTVLIYYLDNHFHVKLFNISGNN